MKGFVRARGFRGFRSWAAGETAQVRGEIRGFRSWAAGETAQVRGEIRGGFRRWAAGETAASDTCQNVYFLCADVVQVVHCAPKPRLFAS